MTSTNTKKNMSKTAVDAEVAEVAEDKYFPRDIGIDGIIGEYGKLSNSYIDLVHISDSQLFNQFFNGDNNLEEGENLYFKVLKVLFTTRLQHEYLDKKSKKKYIIKNILLYKNNTDTEEYKSIDDMKNITDTHNIIIICGTPSRINHVWVYVTNKNWDKITELIKSYTKVSLFGPVNTTIGHYWMYKCNNLKSVDFIGLNSLKTVGDQWMYDCKNLESVDFRGLSSLESVGNGWISGSTSICNKLKSINFRGLNSLKTVGEGWLSGPKLESINFSGLSSLESVGDWWFSCDNFKSLDFTGLSSLKTVGDWWMFHCDHLESVNFTGLSSLENVGYNWMTSCKKLKNENIEFGNLHNIERLLDIRNNRR